MDLHSNFNNYYKYIMENNDNFFMNEILYPFNEIMIHQKTISEMNKWFWISLIIFHGM